MKFKKEILNLKCVQIGNFESKGLNYKLELYINIELMFSLLKTDYNV
jgi:hypothetical protein